MTNKENNYDHYIRALKDSERITTALYQITDQAYAAENIDEYYVIIHNIIASLTYAESFFIALYDEDKDSINFPYIVDSKSDISAEELANLSVEMLNQTLTGYMLRTGKMLHADAQMMRHLTETGEVNDVGRISNEWLGFPLKKGKEILGAMVVQSYEKGVGYNQKDIELLQFVSQHVATALMRKQSEEALRKSEKEFREVLENSSVVSYKFNLEKNCYQYISSNCIKYLGMSQKQYIDLDFTGTKDRIHPDDRTIYKEKFRKLITQKTNDSNNVRSDVEYRWQHYGDNKYHWYSDSRTVIVNEVGVAVAIIGSIRDITDIKESEEKFRNVETALNKIEELENIGVLAGGLAHDFNNILTGIFGNIALVKMKLSSKHPVFKYLLKAEKSMDRATRLTKQLLTFSKGGEPIKEEVILTELIEDTVLFDLSGSNVKPIFDFSDNISDVYVDKGQIQQVISNLVINADQAMPDGGIISIAVKNITVEQGQLPIIKPGSYVRIKLQDQGSGIDERIRERIFAPYFSTKEKGSGLGLTTVYSIIKKHQGFITVESEMEQGTTFLIYLPVLEPEQTMELGENKGVAEELDNNKILVMDDDEEILNLVTAILEMHNCVVTTALDGNEMLEKYQQSMDESVPYNIVIMDLTIPGGMGGKEAITELLKIDKSAKCIVSSGYADDPIMANYAKYGFRAAISKPFAIDEMNSLIENVVSQ